jgi:hypothetical protein
MATKPLPPGLLSIRTGWPHFLLSFSAMTRSAESGPLPAENGVMILTGRLGKVCAHLQAAQTWR